MGTEMAELVADNQLLRSMLQNIVADSSSVKQAHRQANDGIDRILVCARTGLLLLVRCTFPRTFALT